MNSHKYFPSLVCGFSAAVISTIPGVKSIGCCLIVPAAAWLALVLNEKINKVKPPVPMSKAFLFGLLTGLFAALFSTLFDVIITFIMHTNEFVQTLPQTEAAVKGWNLGQLWDETSSLLHMMSTQIQTTGFSLIYTISIFFSNIIIDSIFGMIGGLIGMSIQNKRKTF
jgi:Protein of unknown function (DUF4199)